MDNTYDEIKCVVDNSNYVKINENMLKDFVINFEIPNYKHWYSSFDLKLGEKEKILLVFIIESLNFCFWQKPKYKVIYHNEEVKGSEALFLRLLDISEKNFQFLDINYLHEISYDEFKNIFLSDIGELSLIETRYKLFLDTINVIYKKKEEFYFLGKKYDVIRTSNEGIALGNEKVFVNKYITPEEVDKWYKKEALRLFSERLELAYNSFSRNIPHPTLTVRKMTTRWGVCNTKSMTVTLNTELIHKKPYLIDYVIVHELSHFSHMNHSAAFWKCVEKHYPRYKEARKELKS